LPGTHAKWAETAGAAVHSFATYMTGELRQILLEHSILRPEGHAAEAPFDPAAFERGVLRARATPALTRALFGVRAEALAGRLAPEAAASFLTGILIGHEVACAHVPEGTEVTLIAAPALAKSYRTAFDLFGIRTRLIDGLAAAREGLYLIGCAAGLIVEYDP
jgi:2-dehydro-3-deoxygalactonokinase